jgi:hypothetical protein
MAHLAEHAEQPALAAAVLHACRGFLEERMQRELTPREARAGAVSGRVITVLLISFVGACAALGLAWAYFMPR